MYFWDENIHKLKTHGDKMWVKSAAKNTQGHICADICLIGQNGKTFTGSPLSVKMFIEVWIYLLS